MKNKAFLMFRLNIFKKLLLLFVAFFLLCVFYFTWIFLSLPKLLKVSDYQPPQLSEVYDRKGKKVGEFFKQRRVIAAYEDFPDFVIHAFISAEDGSFFSHKGLNYKAIARAFMANLKAGKKVQGGSTITQQLARTLLLSSQKTYTRKFKEAVLALRMETALSKQDILYIYLNQIYFGHGAYGLEMASRIYFRKSIKNISLAEAALLAGLPKAPSRFSPIYSPARAKSRQIYVLNRMRQEGYISEEEMNQHALKDIKVFVREDFSGESPYYLETVRRLLSLYLKSKEILESGLHIQTAMDLEKQKQAQVALKQGLEDLDKRRGFRGVEKNLANKEEQTKWLKKRDENLRSKLKKQQLIPGFSLSLNEEEEIPKSFFKEFKDKFKALEEKDFSKEFWFKNKEILKGEIFQTLISHVEKEKIKVLSPWGIEILTLKSFNWALPIDKKESRTDTLLSAKEIFKVHDLILVRVKEDETPSNPLSLELYQEPLVEGAFLSFDLQNQDIIALVGGYDFNRSQYNRAYQSRRQTGSVFKPFIYGAALEKGFHPASLISDLPVVFDEEDKQPKHPEEEKDLKSLWRPTNISNRFLGDILFRRALIRSLNVPTIRLIEKIGLEWAQFYVRRLGLFSPLNPDFTMALGSSSLSLYETLKAFSVIARQGQNIQPLVIHSVKNFKNQEILSQISLNDFFKKEIREIEKWIQTEGQKWFKDNTLTAFNERWQSLNPSQRIPASNSYVLMNLLEAVVKDPEGTGQRAKVLNRPLGGKTGSTDGYYDAWFVGASPFISAGVWMGFDSEKSLGKGETGGRSALPAWIEYMKQSHKNLPAEEFPIPDQVVFANIDTETGQLVSKKTRQVVHQAFIQGSEPQEEFKKKELKESDFSVEDTDFLKEDLSQK